MKANNDVMDLEIMTRMQTIRPLVVVMVIYVYGFLSVSAGGREGGKPSCWNVGSWNGKKVCSPPKTGTTKDSLGPVMADPT